MRQVVLSPNHSLLETFENVTQAKPLLQGQHGSSRIVPYLKFLNDARGKNKIKVGFNYFSL